MAFGQDCPGGLGDNLFTDGDFGSGPSFVIDQDPMLAPGYNYNKTGPPPDGDYMITNDMNQWAFVYGTWLIIGDNSSDPNGYMMVVNASFEAGFFYEEVVDGLCDNTTYEFSADIINIVRSDVTGHSDPNVSFLIDDDNVLNTGNIPKNEKWNNYSFSFVTEPGQTSVKLSLRNNAPGGTGNDLALDNISFRACGPMSEVGVVGGTQIICEEDLPIGLIALIEGVEDEERLYQWEVSGDGSNWEVIENQTTSRLSYNPEMLERPAFRFSTAATAISFANEKCRFFSDSISVQVSKRAYERFDTICGGTSILLDGATLLEPGLYIQEYMSQLGCDSIVMIHLDTVQRRVLDSELTSQDPMCFGASNGVITASNVTGGYPPYNINIDGKDYPGLTGDDLIAGAYEVLIQDRFNCFDDGRAILIDPDQFDINIGPDLALLLGEEIEINVNGNISVASSTWSEGLSEFDNLASFQYLPLRSGSISVIAFSVDGCEARDTVSITLDTDVSIYIPNAFSPNADGVNDSYYFSPFGKSLGSVSYFNVYDRWGSVVWAYSESSREWDGNDKNDKPMSSGIYPYAMEGRLINGDPVMASGTVMLVR